MLKTNDLSPLPKASRTIQLVLLTFAGLLLILLVIISYTFFQARQVQLDQSAYLEVLLQELELIDDLQSNDDAVHKAVLLHLTSNSLKEKREYEREIRGTQQQSSVMIKELKRLVKNKSRLHMLDKFEEENAAHDTLIAHLLDLSRSGDPKEALAFNRQVITPEYQQHQGYLKQLSDSIRGAAHQSGKQAAVSIASFVDNHKLLLGLTLLVGLIAVLLIRNVFQRLRLDNRILNTEVKERLQLQKALLESQKQYKLLFDSNPIPMWVYDQRNRHFLDVNEATLRGYGYTREEFLQLNIFDIRPETDVPLLKYKLEQQDKKESQYSKTRHKRKDGSIFEVEVVSHALPDWEDSMPRLVVAINVEERQQMIDQLQKSETQLREVSSSIPGAVFQLQMKSDLRYTFTFISEGIKELLQINPQEAYANPDALYRYIAPEDAATVRKALLGSYRKLSPLVVVFRISPPNASTRKWIQAHGLPTLKDAGHVIWNGTMIDITDQKNAQEQLVTSEANLRALLNSSPQAIYLLDSSFRIMMYNSVAKEEVYRSLLRELEIGHHFLEFLPQDMAEDLKLQHAKVLRGETVIYETGRGDFWHEVSLRPVLGPDDRVLAVALSVLDISERKLAMELIRRNEEQLARAQQLAQLGNWELFFEHDHVTWSDSVYDIYGVSKKAFLPTLSNIMLFVPDAERDSLKQAFANAIKSRTIMSVEHSIVRPDGSVRMVYEIGEPEYDAQGKLIRFHGSVQDITERKQTEQEALKAKNLLQSTLENIPEMIFSADSELNMLYVSPQCLELTGYTEEDFLNDPNLWCSTIHDEDRRAVEDNIIPELLAGLRQHCEVRITTKDRQIKWLMLRISPRLDKDGLVYRLDGSASDMTWYKEAEAKRDELTDQLLKQNQNLQQFAYIVSHNLRAPIANILGLTTIYDKHKPDSPMNPRVIDNLFKSAKLLDSTIRDLNDILTIRSELSKVREDVWFSDVFEEVLDSLPDEMMGKDMHILPDFDKAPHVVAVRSYVHSIMHNLVTNALKYQSPDRNLELRLKTFTIPNYICLSVSDNGLGIDLRKEKGKVFGLYKRFHSHAEGRGLGLHLVKTQAELLGGKVEVDSQVNVGTTFNIYFRHTE
ncbi:PAS domain S-box protein [uncultured Pontibacter sp.]|uniref:PAS domain S-box protein n=1 Tax=uncultured Pontibacter sp. TaxID=453356 RepID=UPI002610D91D|nr:PAS domain S-box protein [uncultured Pontibacter sp.]